MVVRVSADWVVRKSFGKVEYAGEGLKLRPTAILQQTVLLDQYLIGESQKRVRHREPKHCCRLDIDYQLEGNWLLSYSRGISHFLTNELAYE